MRPKAKQRGRVRARMISVWLIGLAVPVVALSLIAYPRLIRDRLEPAQQPIPFTGKDPIKFVDARLQAAEFISYDRSITLLSAEQRRIMDEALSSIPAPCCAEYSIATCCCPCNLARSVWGLSKLLITQERADAPRVNAAVSKWIEFTNPSGYTGDACFTRGCERPFEHNGCGGMDANLIR